MISMNFSFFRNIFNKSKKNSHLGQSTVANTEVVIDEKEMILQQLNQEQLE